jgi:hypothetical protein
MKKKKLSLFLMFTLLALGKTAWGMEQHQNNEVPLQKTAKDIYTIVFSDEVEWKNRVEQVKELTKTLNSQEMRTILCDFPFSQDKNAQLLDYMLDRLNEEDLCGFLKAKSSDGTKLHTLAWRIIYEKETDHWSQLFVKTLNKINEKEREKLVFEMENNTNTGTVAWWLVEYSDKKKVFEQCFSKEVLDTHTKNSNTGYCKPIAREYVIRLLPAVVSGIFSFFKMGKNPQANAFSHLMIHALLAFPLGYSSYRRYKSASHHDLSQPAWTSPQSLASIANWTIVGALSLPHLKTLLHK